MKYSTILRPQIDFSENTLNFLKTREEKEGEGIIITPHPVEILVQGKMIELVGLQVNCVGPKGKERSVGNPLQNFSCYLQGVNMFTLWSVG